MITENLSTLKINKLTQAQYERELEAGRLDPNALYLTPDEEIDLSEYATVEELNNKADATHNHDDKYYTEIEIDQKLLGKSDATHNHDDKYDVKGSATTAANAALASAKSYTDTKTTGLASTNYVDSAIASIPTKLPMLDGSTDDITPTQVYNAMTEDRTVGIVYSSAGLGDIVFTSFMISTELMAIVSTCVIEVDANIMAVQLIGSLEYDIWQFQTSDIPQQDSIDALQNELDSHTHTVANITDLTATATELNYMDGVTSNVQTQIDSVKNAKADWNQNDSTQLDYIKNRPFYETDPVELVIAEGITSDGELFTSANVNFLTLGKTYTVIFDDTTYSDLECIDIDGLAGLGSADFSYTDYPFALAVQNGTAMIFAGDGASHSIKVIEYVGEVIQLERKYIADHLDKLAGEKVKGKVYIVDETETVAAYGAEVFNDYNKNIATGRYSHAEGSNTIATGDYSHAEGIESMASGHYSHAEGVAVVASGNVSHAEGSQTTASGFVAHVEGQHSEATNDCAHAEGFASKATGQYSHAQGDNAIASGKGAHAEGYSTKAIGSYSHAEGTSTTASGRAQHVQGKYNIEDASSETYSYSKYAHIVGNGTGNSVRSNAHTLDWDGNAWFAGDVYVGSTSGTNKDEGSVKLLKEGDAVSVIIREW